MLKKHSAKEALVIFGTFAAMGAVRVVIAQKREVPKPPSQALAAQDTVKKVLVSVRTNSNGKVTKQEWMQSMEAEFDRLDENKDGELDANELAELRPHVIQFSNGGK